MTFPRILLLELRPWITCDEFSHWRQSQHLTEAGTTIASWSRSDDSASRPSIGIARGAASVTATGLLLNGPLERLGHGCRAPSCPSLVRSRGWPTVRNAAFDKPVGEGHVADFEAEKLRSITGHMRRYVGVAHSRGPGDRGPTTFCGVHTWQVKVNLLATSATRKDEHA